MAHRFGAPLTPSLATYYFFRIALVSIFGKHRTCKVLNKHACCSRIASCTTSSRGQLGQFPGSIFQFTISVFAFLLKGAHASCVLWATTQLAIIKPACHLDQIRHGVIRWWLTLCYQLLHVLSQQPRAPSTSSLLPAIKWQRTTPRLETLGMFAKISCMAKWNAWFFSISRLQRPLHLFPCLLNPLVEDLLILCNSSVQTSLLTDLSTRWSWCPTNELLPSCSIFQT